MDIYQGQDIAIPLTLDYVRGNSRVSGLTVTVQVTNANGGATLLASTACPEIGTSGIYNYYWTHGLSVTTSCIVRFFAGTVPIDDSILIQFAPSGGRGA